MAKRLADRSRALAASTSRFLGGALETNSSNRCCVAWAISLTARWNAASLAFDGFDVPATFRTYCKAASCTSALLAGGSKLFNGRIFRHMPTILPDVRDAALRQAQGTSPMGSGRISRAKLRCGRLLFGRAERAGARS